MKKGDKNTENIEHLKKTAKDLESLLMNTGNTDASGMQVEKHQEILPKLKAIRPLDYDTVKSDADEQARQIVESAVLMYLPADFVKNHDYVFQKMEIDKLTVSDLIFQMKTAEHAIKKLLEEIDSGSVRDRSFEVLSSLQKSKMEIVKHLAQFVVIMENNYKNLKIDYHHNVEKPVDALPAGTTDQVEEGDKHKFRGTKGLMGILQSHINPKKNEFTEVNSEDNATGEQQPGAGTDDESPTAEGSEGEE